MATRTEVTAMLHAAVDQYFTPKMYSCHHEVGLVPRGRLRADVLAFTTDLDIVIVEVKSGPQDFDSDTKWRQYLPYCNRMYFLVHHTYWESDAADRLRAQAGAEGVGILVLGANGRTKSCLRCTGRDLTDRGWVRRLITGLAWRTGAHRGNTKRQRITCST